MYRSVHFLLYFLIGPGLTGSSTGTHAWTELIYHMYYLWPSLSVWARVMLTSVQEDVGLLSDKQRQFSSGSELSCVVPNSLQPHGLQHIRLPCPSPVPGTYSNLMFIESVMPSNHLIVYLPLLFRRSIFTSIRVFTNESVICIRWPEYWSFSFRISSSSEYSGLISFGMDWFDLLQSKGLLRVFSNTTVQKHQFFGAQLSL